MKRKEPNIEMEVRKAGEFTQVRLSIDNNCIHITHNKKRYNAIRSMRRFWDSTIVCSLLHPGAYWPKSSIPKYLVTGKDLKIVNK